MKKANKITLMSILVLSLLSLGLSAAEVCRDSSGQISMITGFNNNTTVHFKKRTNRSNGNFSESEISYDDKSDLTIIELNRFPIETINLGKLGNQRDRLDTLELTYVKKVRITKNANKFPQWVLGHRHIGDVSVINKALICHRYVRVDSEK